jgi:hypothetical protein
VICRTLHSNCVMTGMHVNVLIIHMRNGRWKGSDVVEEEKKRKKKSWTLTTTSVSVWVIRSIHIHHHIVLIYMQKRVTNRNVMV